MVACWQIWIRRNKTIFEDDFQRPTDHTYMILKMVEDIDTPNILLMFANVTLFSLVGKDLRRGGLNLTVMEHTKIRQVLLVVVDSFKTQMADGLKATCKNLEHVTLSVLICGECTWECSLLGDKVSTIFKWKVTQKLWLHWSQGKLKLMGNHPPWYAAYKTF